MTPHQASRMTDAEYHSAGRAPRQLVQLPDLGPSTPSASLQQVHTPDFPRGIADNDRLPVLVFILCSPILAALLGAEGVVWNHLDRSEAPERKGQQYGEEQQYACNDASGFLSAQGPSDSATYAGRRSCQKEAQALRGENARSNSRKG